MEYLKDPIDAACKYECIAPLIQDAFLNPDKIDACVKKDRGMLDPNSYDKKIPRVITLDPGITHDAYALVMGHRRGDKIVEDYIHTWQGTPKKPVQIAEVEEHILQLCRNFWVTDVALDQYQSAATIQRLSRMGIPVRETQFTHTYNRQIYQNLRELVNGENIELLDHEQQTQELKHLQIRRSGDYWSVAAPESGPCTTDDIADALANCAWILVQSRPGAGDAFIFR